MTAEIENTNLLTVNSFIERYRSLIGDCKTRREAYEATEKEYNLSFGKRRYSSYGGFRVTLTRWNYKRLCKKKYRDAKIKKCKESRNMA